MAMQVGETGSQSSLQCGGRRVRGPRYITAAAHHAASRPVRPAAAAAAACEERWQAGR